MQTQDTNTQHTTSAGLIIPAISQPWPAQGGIYIGQLPPAGDFPGAHIVASTEETMAEWGAYGVAVDGANSRYDGRANTAALLAHQHQGKHTHPAAQWASQYSADGHTDFHLPSLLELQIAHAFAPQVFNKDSWYWTSTQGSAFSAFGQDFEYGDSGWRDKDLERRVRAVRWIPL
jgi:hypothetical protein